MISYNIKDYVFRINNFLENEVCDQLVNDLKNENWLLHSYTNAAANNQVSYDTDLSVISSESVSNNDNVKLVNERIWSALKQYIDFLNMPWNAGWTGYTYARFNKYSATKEMRLHCDHIHSMFDGERKGVPILTVLGSLNDEYEGGEFILWDEVWEIPKGSLLIFPSNFLYPHKVNPVKSGVRYSYVSWTW